ncbi:MAG: NAD(P)H-hydrate dehydratase [Nioella sp.]
MADLLTAAQMRAVEGALIGSGAVTGLDLMERAGRGVVEAVFARWPALAAAPHRALVFCGPGNNGGDGYVIARLLHDRGWQVAVHVLGDPEALPPDARANARLWQARGAVLPLSAAMDAWQDPPDLFIDAIFGTGLTRPLDREVVQALDSVRAGRKQRPDALRAVAVDMPSGVCSDSGRNMGAPVHHDLTVTFHSAKPGHFLAEGPGLCGAMTVVDIGLPPRTVPEAARLVEAPGPLGKCAGHKYDHGHAVVLSGPMGRSGAARLAARAALRIGAGLVTVAAPGAAMLECAAQLTAIMLRRCDGTDGLGALLVDDRVTALCLGPGLGVGPGTEDLVEVALTAPGADGRGVVLDADALTSFEGAPGRLFALTSRVDRVVLTPHVGEFRRLFPDLAERLDAAPVRGPAYSRLDAVRAAAGRAGCAVVLKGPDTVIGGPGGAAAVHGAVYDRSVPWLATAGAGDVLAGLIAGLLARGQAAMPAAQAAAWLHVEAARRVGPGLVAEDLAEALPGVLRSLGADG